MPSIYYFAATKTKIKYEPKSNPKRHKKSPEFLQGWW
jgi:hypothetical protein